jgi:alpha-methylacyl-CoA racemase
MERLPMHGVRILDLSRQLPGPLATQVLADFGAEVIKVEDTRSGDNFRYTEPKINGMSARHLQLNRNKRGLAIDLKSEAGRKIFLELAAQSHVVFEQFRPGVVKRLGIDYEAVKAVNPAVVYCSLSGFGQEGPYRDIAAHDPNYLSLAGVLSLIGRRGGEPSLSGPQLADITAAHMVTIGILMALRNAEATGKGEYIDVSLFDSAFSLAVTGLSNYLGGGQAPTRGGERHNGKYPWADIYRTADGEWITITAIEEQFYANLCRALGREDWLPHQYADEARQQEIREGMAGIFAGRTRDEWFALLKDKDVCIGPVLSIEEAVNSEQVRQRGNIISHRHPVAGETRLLRNPIRMRSVDPAIRAGAPLLGEHSGEILAELGYQDADIKRLVEQGVIAVPTGTPAKS